MYILLAEDDELIGDAVHTYLSRFDHTVEWVRDGTTADEALTGNRFDLVLLDVGLPFVNGFDVLKNFRARDRETPVIIITAKPAVDDVVRGLSLGADDYIRKPFELSELVARCEAAQRRTSTIKSSALVHGDLAIDTESRNVSFKGRDLSLSTQGYKLLCILLERPNVSFTREDLLQRIHGWDSDAHVNAIDVLVSRLRKLTDNNIIQTVRGVGYKMGSP